MAIVVALETLTPDILVRVAIPMYTTCARGYSQEHNKLILVHVSVRVAIATLTCAWLSHAHVYSIQICEPEFHKCGNCINCRIWLAEKAWHVQWINTNKADDIHKPTVFKNARTNAGNIC